jgi:hypothetical protein
LLVFVGKCAWKKGKKKKTTFFSPYFLVSICSITYNYLPNYACMYSI